jgi:hypothetical protein
MRKLPSSSLLLTCILCLGACQSSSDRGGTAIAPDTAGETQAGPYLDTGPNTSIDLGPGKSSLLETLKKEKEENARLQEDRDKLRKELRDLKIRFSQLESELGQEKNKLSASESGATTAAKKIHTLEARVMDLAIQKARLQEQLLAEQIQNLERELNEKLKAAGWRKLLRQPDRGSLRCGAAPFSSQQHRCSCKPVRCSPRTTFRAACR